MHPVAQLVDVHILPQDGRDHAQAPVQADIARGVAAAPPRLVIADGDRRKRDAYARRQHAELPLQQRAARALEVFTHGGGVLHEKSAARLAAAHGAEAEAMGLAVKQQHLALPHVVKARIGKLFQLFTDPVALLFHKGADKLVGEADGRLDDHGTRRHGDDEGAAAGPHHLILDQSRPAPLRPSRRRF